jgi:hypothetical protein
MTFSLQNHGVVKSMTGPDATLKILMNLAKVQAVVARRFDRLSVRGIWFSDFMILYLLQHPVLELLWLQVYADNAAGCALYQKMGAFGRLPVTNVFLVFSFYG